MAPYDGTTESNTFQLAIISNASSSYVALNYGTISSFNNTSIVILGNIDWIQSNEDEESVAQVNGKKGNSLQMVISSSRLVSSTKTADIST